MKAVRTSKPVYKIGDLVQAAHPRYTLYGRIVDDRVGHNGSFNYLVKVFNDPEEATIHTVSEDELQYANLAEMKKPLDKAQIIAYLAAGGLALILGQADPEADQQPRVWLWRNCLGGVTYTLSEAHGIVGGVPLPVGALHWTHKIYRTKKDEVVTFLLGFGLTGEEAEEVLGNIGIVC